MIPTAARTPEPASGTVDVRPDAQVTWRAGREAAQHTVYVSTDQDEVADGTAPFVTTPTNSLDLTSLDLALGQTYYWRVDEVNEAEVSSVWAGPLWRLGLVDALVVDDFESYNNASPHRPFQSWIDGIGYSADEFFPAGHSGNGTGAAIGHDIWSLASPYYNGDIMETSITIPGSSRALPFYYSNTEAAASQTDRLFAEAQDWRVGGAKTLLLDFFGAPDNTGQLYVKINDTKVVFPGDPESIALNVWQTWTVDLSTVAGIENVTSLTIGVDDVGASGLLIIDDLRLSSQDPVIGHLGDKLAVNAYEWVNEGFLDNTPATPDYWGSDVDMTKLTDGVIAPDYSASGACAGWNFSTANGPFGPTLYFDLGSIQSMGAVAIYHQPKNYGFETVRVSVSSLDNPNRVDIDDMADWTGEDIHQSDHYGIGDGNGTSVVQTVPIDQQGRWVRFQFLNQEAGYDTAWTMFSEFTFYSE
ncbi:MAG: hypothetical protein GY809_28380 [Planctomycetes bacterium]|nr:hypothetical protein [Planctomycetota bacterium]